VANFVLMFYVEILNETSAYMCIKVDQE